MFPSSWSAGLPWVPALEPCWQALRQRPGQGQAEDRLSRGGRSIPASPEIGAPRRSLVVHLVGTTGRQSRMHLRRQKDSWRTPCGGRDRASSTDAAESNASQNVLDLPRPNFGVNRRNRRNPAQCTVGTL